MLFKTITFTMTLFLFSLSTVSALAFEPQQETPAEHLPRLYTEKFEKQEIDACIESLCGPASGNQSDSRVIETRLKVPSLAAKEIWQAQFRGQLAELLAMEKANRLTEAKLLTRALKSERTLKFTDAQKAWLLFKEIAEKIGPIVRNYIAWDLKTFNVILNVEKTDELLAPLPSEIKKATRLILERYFIPSFRQQGLDPFENPIVRRTKLKYQNMNEMEARIADAKMLLEVGEKMASLFGKRAASYFFDDYLKDLLSKAKRGEELSASDSRNYIQIATILDLLNLIYNDADVFNALSKIPFNNEERLKKLGKSEHLKKNLELLKKMDVSAETAIVSATCAKMLAAAIDLNVSELQLKKLPKMIEEVKQASQTVADRFSDEFFRSTLDSIDNIEFSYPKTDEENIESIASTFAAEKRRVRNASRILQDSPETRQLILFIAMLKKDKEPAGLSTGSAVLEACQALPTKAISDFAVFSTGKIGVSWYTAAYPEMGVSILAHEIGHVVSKNLKMMQKTDFATSLNCVANRNPFVVDPQELTPHMNTIWSHEDWADYFSSLVMKELEKNGSSFATKANLGCSFVKQKDDSYFGNGLVPGKGHTHSSGFLRLLNIATDRDQMTPQCSHFLKSVSAAGRKLKCE
ncbi:MAG: hypothetical protein AB7O96_09670 [Pseudobdellovibrionaceae bacterium]